MLEILILINLSKRIGALAESRGSVKGRSQALLLLLWFSGEFLGMSLGLGLAGGGGFLIAYALALVGANSSAWLAFFAARRLDQSSLSRIWTIILAFIVIEATPTLISILLNILDIEVGNLVWRTIDLLVTAAGGLILGWKLASNRPAWWWVAGMAVHWAITFGAAYLLNLVEIEPLYGNMIFWTVYTTAAGLVIGFLFSQEAPFQSRSPLLRLVVIGLIGGVIINTLNSWFYTGLVSPLRSLPLYSAWLLVESIYRGVLLGLLLGFGLELPFLRKPAAPVGPVVDAQAPLG
ncbi:MAG: hypothetical protein ACKOC5_05245 [Chloroflexota bacterium]